MAWAARIRHDGDEVRNTPFAAEKLRQLLQLPFVHEGGSHQLDEFFEVRQVDSVTMFQGVMFESSDPEEPLVKLGGKTDVIVLPKSGGHVGSTSFSSECRVL